MCKIHHTKNWVQLRGRRSENWWKKYQQFKIVNRTILLSENSNALKRLLVKFKEESAKVGPHLNIKKTKIITTEEIHNFNINNKDTEIVKDENCLPQIVAAASAWVPG